MPEAVDITVGHGPVSKIGYYGTVLSWLASLGTLVTTLAGALPAGVDPSVGLGLTAAAGVIATILHAATGLSRAKFADAKAKVMAGQSGYEVFVDSLPTDVDDPTEPTDTNVPPPVEPAVA